MEKLMDTNGHYDVETTYFDKQTKTLKACFYSNDGPIDYMEIKPNEEMLSPIKNKNDDISNMFVIQHDDGCYVYRNCSIEFDVKIFHKKIEAKEIISITNYIFNVDKKSNDNEHLEPKCSFVNRSGDVDVVFGYH